MTQTLYKQITGSPPDTYSETYMRFCLLVHYVKTGQQDKIKAGAKDRKWKLETAERIREILH